MSAYANDPRVTYHACGCHIDVTTSDAATSGPVWLLPDGAYATRAGVPESGNGMATFDTADEAIRSLIGDPL